MISCFPSSRIDIFFPCLPHDLFSSWAPLRSIFFFKVCPRIFFSFWTPPGSMFFFKVCPRIFFTFLGTSRIDVFLPCMPNDLFFLLGTSRINIFLQSLSQDLIFHPGHIQNSCFPAMSAPWSFFSCWAPQGLMFFFKVCPRILFSFLGTSRINVFSSKSSPGSCFPSWAPPFKSPHGLIYFTKTSIVTGPKINTWKSWKRKNELAQHKNRWYVISLICYT